LLLASKFTKSSSKVGYLRAKYRKISAKSSTRYTFDFWRFYKTFNLCRCHNFLGHWNPSNWGILLKPSFRLFL